MNQHVPGQKTLITIHGYAGDAHQIVGNLPSIEHHQCPIVIFGTEDAPIYGIGPHICLNGGKKAYIGQDSLDRQLIQMRMALKVARDGKFDFLLMHDSDSITLCPELPDILYRHPKEVFSNEVNDFRQAMPEFGPEFHKPLPPIAMQPPYFMSTDNLERLVAVGPTIQMCPVCPFIDWYMVQLVWAAGVNHSRFPNCVSHETTTPRGEDLVAQHVQQGATFIHYSKRPEVRARMQGIYDSLHRV